MRRVLVTHTDSALGRRLCKTLYHDPDVGLVLGVGTGPTPGWVGAHREKCVYERLDLARARHLQSFFASERLARAGIDSVIHLPFVENPGGERIPANVPSLVSETRRLLDELKKQPAIERFVYLSSAFVYRPEPGNGNFVDEDQELAFERDAGEEVRAWVDVDLLCQRELGATELKVTILRAASIVTDGGDFLQSPPLRGGRPPAGFDPMLSVVAERDVARALVVALHGDRPGVYNIASPESYPLSELRPSTPVRIGPLPLPGSWVALGSLVGQALGRPLPGETRLHRHGIVLNTQRASEQLGFEPWYRIEIRRRGDAAQVEPVRAR